MKRTQVLTRDRPNDTPQINRYQLVETLNPANSGWRAKRNAGFLAYVDESSQLYRQAES